MIIPGLAKKVRAYLKRNPRPHKPADVAQHFGIVGSSLTRLARRDPYIQLVGGVEGHHSTALLVAHADARIPRLSNSPGYKIIMALRRGGMNITALREAAGVGNAACRNWVLRLEGSGVLEKAGGTGRWPVYGLSRYGSHMAKEQAALKGRSTVSMLEVLAPETADTSLRADMHTADKLVEQLELAKEYDKLAARGKVHPWQKTELAEKYNTSVQDLGARATFSHSPIGGASEQRAMFIFTLIRKHHGAKTANAIWDRMEAAGGLSFKRSESLTGQNYERRRSSLEREMARRVYEKRILSLRYGGNPYAAVTEISKEIEGVKVSTKRNTLDRDVSRYAIMALEEFLKEAEVKRSKAIRAGQRR